MKEKFPVNILWGTNKEKHGRWPKMGKQNEQFNDIHLMYCIKIDMIY